MQNQDGMVTQYNNYVFRKYRGTKRTGRNDTIKVAG